MEDWKNTSTLCIASVENSFEADIQKLQISCRRLKEDGTTSKLSMKLLHFFRMEMSSFASNIVNLRELLIYFFKLKESIAEALRLLVEVHGETG